MDLTSANTNWLNPLMTAGDNSPEMLLLQYTDYHSTFPMKSLFSRRAAASHCCKQMRGLYCKKEEKKMTMTVLRDKGGTMT